MELTKSTKSVKVLSLDTIKLTESHSFPFSGETRKKYCRHFPLIVHTLALPVPNGRVQACVNDPQYAETMLLTVNSGRTAL